MPLLEPTISSTGSTITPQQIEDMPINGRNYLDLLQLVPGFPSIGKVIRPATIRLRFWVNAAEILVFD